MFTDAAMAMLSHWGLSVAHAKEAGIIERADASSVYDGMQPMPALVIPYFNLDGTRLTYTAPGGIQREFARLRYISPTAPKTGFFKVKAQRYVQPAKTGVQVYFPPCFPWDEIARDPNVSFIITEGEAKALVAGAHGFRAVGLGGVFNFTGVNGELVPVLEQFVWTLRHIYIIFDSDAVTNPNVRAAEARLINELQGKRGAVCHIVRLPQERDEKVGLDDYLNQHGPDALHQLMKQSQGLSPLDIKVIAMNKRYSWISREGKIWDEDQGLLLQKENFLKGEDASSEVVVTMTGVKGGIKRVKVADEWITHPHTLRYSELLFRPGDPVVVAGESGLHSSLNLWRGWENTEPGDVSCWLELSAAIFAGLPQDLRDFPIKLLAYKAQHPAEKVPIAMIMVGQQGTGKTAWTTALAAAFGKYYASVTPESLTSPFQPFLEKSLLAAVHEITPQQMTHSSERLKSMISDLRRPMNDKYRSVRDINSYTMYIFTGNFNGIASVSADDRRYFVIQVPSKKGQDELGRRVHEWVTETRAKGLMHYLLNYPLGDWRPPTRAPMTAAKDVAVGEGRTLISAVAEEMLTADQHVIVEWLRTAEGVSASWEQSGITSMAQRGRAGLQAVQNFQVRDFYTAEELGFIFPTLTDLLMGDKFSKRTGPGALSQELRNCGIPSLVNLDNPKGFTHKGVTKQYLVIANQGEWGEPIHQADFERAMANWPTYQQLKNKRT